MPSESATHYDTPKNAVYIVEFLLTFQRSIVSAGSLILNAFLSCFRLPILRRFLMFRVRSPQLCPFLIVLARTGIGLRKYVLYNMIDDLNSTT
ncbi:hypothetical protein BDR06DRAFT_962828 [Suillus hirtellus]|nr:hypothetical protein BDR06DRAFT_962828 [Suillus hirtellus]